MDEDLTINESAEQEQEAEFEVTTRSEYLAAAVNAISAMDGLDLMTKIGGDTKRRIIRKSVKIIDSIISELYDELFESDEEE
jgi:hypothetical protein